MAENEEDKATIEDRIKQIQLDTAIVEYELKKAELSSQSSTSAKVLAVLANPVVVVGLISVIVALTSGVVTWIVSTAQANLERQKNDNALIIEAIKTGDMGMAMTNLRFLIDAGILSEQNQNLREFMKNTRSGPGGPVLPGQGTYPWMQPRQ
jgi:hypothetical protein